MFKKYNLIKNTSLLDRKTKKSLKINITKLDLGYFYYGLNIN